MLKAASWLEWAQSQSLWWLDAVDSVSSCLLCRLPGYTFYDQCFLFLPALKFDSPHASLLIKNLPGVSSLPALKSQPWSVSSQFPPYPGAKRPQLVLREHHKGPGAGLRGNRSQYATCPPSLGVWVSLVLPTFSLFTLLLDKLSHLPACVYSQLQNPSL